jgi:dienelactone hydrolase
MELRPGRAGALVDSPDGLVVDGAPPGGVVRIEANLELAGQSWSCSGEFVADGDGQVDTTRDASSGGSYSGVDPFGLFWSAEVSPAYDWEALHPMSVTLRATCDDLVGDASYLRKVRADDTTWHDVEEEGVVGRLFLPAGAGPAPGVVLVAGAVGGRGLPETAPLLAGHGVAVLSLAHWNHPGLPEAMHEIDVEVVGRACDWLRSLDDVLDQPPAVVGAARGGELALLAASLLTDRVGPAASLSGSAVASGAVGPGTEAGDAAWSHAGTPVPHLSNVDHDWHTLLVDEQAVAAARIPLERATGPLLLLSGEDDRTWPSARLSALGADRVQAAGTPTTTCLAYPDAGHLACVPPGFPLASRFELPGGMVRELGGTRAGNHAARLDSWRRLLDHVGARPT